MFHFSVFLLHVMLLVRRMGEAKELARPCPGLPTRAAARPLQKPRRPHPARCSAAFTGMEPGGPGPLSSWPPCAQGPARFRL